MNLIQSSFVAATLVGAGFSGVAEAQTQIPLEVLFEGTPVSGIAIYDGVEPTTLQPPDANRVYRASVAALAPNQVAKKIKVIVFYGNVRIPLVLNLTPGRTKLVVDIRNFTPPTSCFIPVLERADQFTDNEFDAMRRMLTVAYAIRMDGNSNCRALNLEPRAALIRNNRNANLVRTSSARYALNQDWVEELAGLPRNAFRTPPAVLAARAQVEANNALFADIYNIDIKQAATPAKSLEIARNLKTLRDTDPAVAAALVTAPLDEDIRFYELSTAAGPK